MPILKNEHAALLMLVFVCGALAGSVIVMLAMSRYPSPAREVIFTETAPRPIGSYSQAAMAGGFVFTAGQIGLDPVTGNLSETTEGQTVQAMENLNAILMAEGLDFSHVVMVHIYLVDLADWNTVNTVYGRYFESGPPARSVVGVKGLPRDARIEIEMIAQRE